ncbi:DUF1003 domain-containing protein [Ancylobacter dichloromethanicus]|uniref:DUF1003 domain-containing protein n=1 Tax=Ancylobacter dichloromethanicus TaxID=518825 RepID=A0A9W6N135_9HYPH|nr:DUF1003 domain-containing protein [Ancylobacter dichloromethanicus]MBS7556606.1 DUF1003 domain-containing protein [Ancylobacter dichloromethanicus]GLK73798.1 hypothetical protein GCM10017643_39160 [Ancylobacter dichloromethanicus]
MTHRTRQPHEPPAQHTCALTGQVVCARDGVRLDMLRPAMADHIRALHPDIAPDAYISRKALGKERAAYIAETLRAERGDLSRLDHEVIESLAANDILTENVEAEIEGARSFGQRAADVIAAFGGSWTFIISFVVFINLWMAVNVAGLMGAFDPYPFILLNLVLSCVAALQAPVIMMSQKRQEEKDRQRSENDYRVNLKAELEIRHLHEKIDHMLTRQWERLAEIQAIQIELMEDLAGRRR